MCYNVSVVDDHHQSSVEQFELWLKRIDTNGDGRISKKELAEALRGHGILFKRWRAQRAVARVDLNHNGVVDGNSELGDLMEYAQKHWGFIFSG